MRRVERRSLPHFQRLEARDLLSPIAGTIAGTLVFGPLAGRQTPPGDFRIFGSGSVHPLGRANASGITPSTSGEVPGSLTIRGPRGFVRLEISSHGADALGTSVPVQVRITGHSPRLSPRTGDRGTGTLAEGLPTPGGTIPFRLSFEGP
jgi:hypothetical protein